MEDIIPSRFQLGQNFPNPFKEYTLVKYCLPIRCSVDIKIINWRGELVKEIFYKSQDAGTYEIKFCCKDLKNGIYHYTICATSLVKGMNKIFEETKQMIVIHNN